MFQLLMLSLHFFMAWLLSHIWISLTLTLSIKFISHFIIHCIFYNYFSGC